MKIDKLEPFIPSFTDITDWNKNVYASTGGTRSKQIYSNKEEDEYFFKGSKELDDGTIRYPTEFWSEIVSSKIGQWLGFNVLDYNIAYDKYSNQKIGCLSKSMIKYSENKLSEGVDYLVGHDSSYEAKKNEPQYTFYFIMEALKSFHLENKETEFIQMLVFDAIIGNSDRHQENWGFITKFKETIDLIEDEIKTSKGFFKKMKLKFHRKVAKTMQEDVLGRKVDKAEGVFFDVDFSPIYDSGCCLGRELEQSKIEKHLKDKGMTEAFIKRGMSEVRVSEERKSTHFELLNFLRSHKPSIFETIVEKAINQFDKKELEYIINNIDRNLPKVLEEHKLSEWRKTFMVRLITMRFEKIKEIK